MDAVPVAPAPRANRRGLAGAALIVLLVLAAYAPALLLATLTWRQAGDYRDAEMLWQRTLSRNAECWLCWNNLASIRVGQRNYPEAERMYRRAAGIYPRSAEAQYNLGLLAVDRRDLSDAQQRYRALEQIDAGRAEELLSMIRVIAPC